MPLTLDDITREALQLSSKQRLKLVHHLLEADAGQPEPGAEEVWEDEIQARILAVRSGRDKGFSHEEVMEEAKKRLAK